MTSNFTMTASAIMQTVYQNIKPATDFQNVQISPGKQAPRALYLIMHLILPH